MFFLLSTIYDTGLAKEQLLPTGLFEDLPEQDNLPKASSAEGTHTLDEGDWVGHAPPLSARCLPGHPALLDASRPVPSGPRPVERTTCPPLTGLRLNSSTGTFYTYYCSGLYSEAYFPT